MKTLLIPTLLFFSLFACTNQKQQNQANINQEETNIENPSDSTNTPDKKDTISPKKVIIYIDDESKYDTAFVNCLKSGATGVDSIRLEDQKFKFKGGEANIPTFIPTDYAVHYLYEDSLKRYSLTLQRLTLTTISYQLSISDEQYQDTTLRGQVYLFCMFWLAMGAHVDDQTGYAYGIHEYYAKSSIQDTGGTHLALDSTRARISIRREAFKYDIKPILRITQRDTTYTPPTPSNVPSSDQSIP